MLLLNIFAINFMNPTIKVNSRKASLVGKGPPILFSGGLYGSMTRRIYSDLINQLKTDFTIIHFNNIGVTTREDFESLADVLGVSKLGFLSHSSMDHTILRSDRLEKAVLCDPVSLPDIQNGFSSSQVESIAPVLLLNAQKSQNSEFPFILNGFSLNVSGEDVSEEVFEQMGHGDILDNTWAEAADRFGIEGVRFTPSKIDFNEWRAENRVQNERKQIRNEYRSTLVLKMKNFFRKHEKDESIIDIV